MREAAIDSDHPALPGHFPGHPTVPAVLILSRVIAAARRAYPDAKVNGIRKAKFLRRLGPDQPFDIELGTPAEDTLKFACRAAGAVIVQGRLTLGDRDGSR